MNLQKIERAIVVTIGSRLALAAIAVANWDKASWAFQQWSRSGAGQADIMAGAIEGALVIFTYMLAQRLIANAKRLKSDPVQPTKTLWGFVIFLSLLSAFCNGLYSAHFGRLADPLGNIIASIAAGAVLGLAAPLLASGIAYLQGEETATETLIREAEEKRKGRNEKRRKGREVKKTTGRNLVKSSPKAGENSAEISLRADENPPELSAISDTLRGQLATTVEVYSQDSRTTLGDLAKILEVGNSRASEIRSTAVKLRLLEKLSAREFSPNGGDISAVLSVD